MIETPTITLPAVLVTDIYLLLHDVNLADQTELEIKTLEIREELHKLLTNYKAF